MKDKIISSDAFSKTHQYLQAIFEKSGGYGHAHTMLSLVNKFNEARSAIKASGLSLEDILSVYFDLSDKTPEEIQTASQVLIRALDN